MRFFGWVDRVDGTCAVATAFTHFAGLPLWPVASHIVDTNSLETRKDTQAAFLIAVRQQTTTFLSVPLPALESRSVIAGYARTWGALVAMFAVAAAAGSLVFVAAGIVAAILARVVIWRSSVTASNQLGIVALALLGGSFTAFTPIVAIAGAAGALAVVVTLPWRRASPARALELAELSALPDSPVAPNDDRDGAEPVDN